MISLLMGWSPLKPHVSAATMSRDIVPMISLLPLLESSKKEMWQGRRNQVETEEGEKVWQEKD